MNCVLCFREEQAFYKGLLRIASSDTVRKPAQALICSSCTQKLIASGHREIPWDGNFQKLDPYKGLRRRQKLNRKIK